MGDYVQPTLPPEHVGLSFEQLFGKGGGPSGFAEIASETFGGEVMPGYMGSMVGYMGTTYIDIGGYTIEIDWSDVSSDGLSFNFNDDGSVDVGDIYIDDNGEGYWVDFEYGPGKRDIAVESSQSIYVGAQQGGLNFKTLWGDNGSDLSHIDPKTGSEIFPDYCAINLSEALIKSGMSPGGTKCWGNCSSKQSHTIRAQELATWLQGNLSGVKVLTGDNFQEYISGKTGIVFFQNYWQREGETGITGDHIDLWNENEMGSYGVMRTWIRTAWPAVGQGMGMSDLSKSTQVLFWEIK